ncbi:MAG TPA: hypothetical protein VJU59_37905 [Paraburkholderia sp.]|uniref:hypothetical protein n=1 Tax=Paraburkholderia sp. TaxID=1926495 RepID=UPI002B47A8F8|nr:hypothetical protein [Paraburkholderia sp.]HKR45385.1 hypothetical protein [Paraburkholderia sp.]
MNKVYGGVQTDKAPVAAGIVDDDLLLHAVALLPAAQTAIPGWFTRQLCATPVIISWEEDVPDILLRLPPSWNLVEPAFFRGLHDDEDIVSVDPRFCNGVDRCSYAVVAHDDGERFALLMLVNAAEAALMTHRLFRGEQRFDACFGYIR